MQKNPGRYLRLLVFAALAAIIAVTLGMFGLSLWLLLGALVLGSPGFREWVKQQEGYRYRTSAMLPWGDETPARMFASMSVYLLPLSFVAATITLGLVRSGWIYLAFATIGLVGLVLLHRIFVYGDRRLEVAALSSSMADSLRFAGENKKILAPIGLGAILPLLCGLVTMAMWLPASSQPTRAEEPAATAIVEVVEEPQEKPTASARANYVVVPDDEVSQVVETATAEPTYTPQATYTALPTYTPLPTSTDYPTSTTEPTATKVVVEGEMAEVVSITDGDTISVIVNGVEEAVRYIGIDTPEDGETCGDEATAANSRLVSGKTVRLVKDVSDRDRYGRLLRYVYVGETFVNAELVQQGWAIPRRYPPDTKMASVLEAAQTGAASPSCAVVAVPTEEAAEVAVAASTEVPTEASTIAPAPTEAPVGTTEIPLPTLQAALATDIRITSANFDGAVARVESDEFIVITNTGVGVINLGGWRINAGDAGQDFGFPSFDFGPGQSCRIYTNEYHPETCGFSFGSGRAILNNDGDCIYLYDSSGAEVSRYCY